MENNIKVWKGNPILKSQEREFLIVNNQWIIDNSELLRNGGYEIDETFEPKIDAGKESQNEVWIELKESDIFEENQEPLFDFDKPKEEKELKPKKSKK